MLSKIEFPIIQSKPILNICLFKDIESVDICFYDRNYTISDAQATIIDNKVDKEYNRVKKSNYELLDEFEDNSKDFKNDYEPLDENSEEVEDLKLNYEPLTEPRNSYYSTIDFITDIKSDLSKLVPDTIFNLKRLQGKNMFGSGRVK